MKYIWFRSVRESWRKVLTAAGNSSPCAVLGIGNEKGIGINALVLAVLSFQPLHRLASGIATPHNVGQGQSA